MKRFFRSAILIAFHVSFVRPVLLLLGVRYRRRQLVPRGPCLVVANHNSHLDTAVLMSLFPLRRLPHVHPVAAADYFGKVWWRRALAMLLFNGIPIERKAQGGVDPLARAIRELQRGESLILFPEGSRGEAGVVARFRPGVGRLVHAFPGLLVLPVFMYGPERIWPRGKVVPVPLSIDAIVGKPRTYPTEIPAGTIADQVREDVLALMPPAPAPPGPRPKSATRVVVCGIDRAARHDLYREVLERVAGSESGIGLGDPVLEAGPEGVREFVGGVPVARSRWWLGPAAWMLRAGGLRAGSAFAGWVERARVAEAVHHARRWPYVLGDGDPLVDLLARLRARRPESVVEDRDLQELLQYLTGGRRIRLRHWWRLIRQAPEAWLLNVFDLAHLPVPGVLVLARGPVARALAHERASGDPMGSEEQEAFLTRLDAAYAQVGRVLKRRWRTEVIEVEAEGGAVPAEIAAAVRDRHRRYNEEEVEA